MDAIRFRHEPADGFYPTLKRRVAAELRAAGRTGFADRLFWLKGGLFAALAAACYALVLLHPFPLWTLLPLAAGYGAAVILLGINVGHDAAHRTVSRRRWVNDWLQFGAFTLVGVNAYLWRLRHTRSHHIFPNVNGCDIDIDENPFLRLSPNQPWRWWFRWQHLYAPLAYVLVAAHTIVWADWVYLRKRTLANMTGLRHPPHQYLLFVLGKAIYFGLTLGLPLTVLPVAWWQVLLGYLVMTGTVSVVFVFLLIGTHFSDATEFPSTGPTGELPYTWAEHNLATACDWAPADFWAHFFVGGVNAHAAHHLFPKLCHTHYRSVVPVIAATAAEFGLPYHTTSLPGMVAGHFRFLRQMGTPQPIDVNAPAAAAATS